MKSKNLSRKSVLILDNASTHSNVEHLQDGEIKAMFLPPNVTLLFQPMDQEALVSLKRRYRHNLLSSLVLAMGEGNDLLGKLKKIDLLDIVGWVADSWNELEPMTLVRFL